MGPPSATSSRNCSRVLLPPPSTLLLGGIHARRCPRHAPNPDRAPVARFGARRRRPRPEIALRREILARRAPPELGRLPPPALGRARGQPVRGRAPARGDG